MNLRGFSFLFLNRDSLHVKLNIHYAAWSYEKKKYRKIKAYRKSVSKEPTDKRCLLILDLKPFRSYIKGKHSLCTGFWRESSCASNETVDIDTLEISRNGDRRIMQSIRLMGRLPLRYLL